jgi:alanine dehydrogenase
MNVGVVAEIKDQENRVALTPAGAADLVQAGHRVRVQAGAGLGAGFDDDAYARAGAEIVSVREAWANELVLKVKEPLEVEFPFLQHQILFTYLHLSGVDKALTETLLARGTTAVAYETVEDTEGRLPLLAPMSGVAGTMAVTMGSFWLARHNKGRGVLLGKVMGRRHGKVVVIGDGVVGRHAARAAHAIGADVVLLGRHPEREAELKSEVGEAVTFVLSDADHIAEHCADADLLISAVLRRGARAPMIVTEAMVETMQPGAVIVDVSIDQGGSIETARPTTHARPVYREHGVIHYCVANMPGAYPRTSTIALTDATLPYVLKLADQGIDALRDDAAFAKGVNVHAGHICCRAVAEDLDLLDHFQGFSAFDA